MISSVPSPSSLLRVKDLTIAFDSEDPRQPPVAAVHSLSFEINQGEVVAVVGESGSGKSVSALALTGLLPTPPARYLSGEIWYQDENTMTLSREALRQLRGKEIAYIFQEPSASLNPVMSIGAQLREAIVLHQPRCRKVREEMVRRLDEVGIRFPEKRLNNFPHQLSGGMQQRVMIAMALACQPKLLVADEPTTALDVTMQKQIMDLLKAMQRQHGMAVLLITHNFGLVAGFAHRVVVMLRGLIVESGSTEQILESPQHPYTQALIHCIPRLGEKRHRLETIDYSQLL